MRIRVHEFAVRVHGLLRCMGDGSTRRRMERSLPIETNGENMSLKRNIPSRTKKMSVWSSFPVKLTGKKILFAKGSMKGGHEGISDLYSKVERCFSDMDSQPFDLADLNACEVMLLDHSDQIQMDNLVNCRIFIGMLCKKHHPKM